MTTGSHTKSLTIGKLESNVAYRVCLVWRNPEGSRRMGVSTMGVSTRSQLALGEELACVETSTLDTSADNKGIHRVDIRPLVLGVLCIAVVMSLCVVVCSRCCCNGVGPGGGAKACGRYKQSAYPLGKLDSGGCIDYGSNAQIARVYEVKGYTGGDGVTCVRSGSGGGGDNQVDTRTPYQNPYYHQTTPPSYTHPDMSHIDSTSKTCLID